MLVSAVIVAGGVGKRMGATISKQYLMLQERPILAHTLEVFQNCQRVDEIILVIREEERQYCMENVISLCGDTKIKAIVAGGKERQDSVWNGLQKVSTKDGIVLVHDGARPFVTEELIQKTIKEVIEKDAVVVGVKVKDTIKVTNDLNEIIDTPVRDTLWSVQTPQGFKASLLLDAYLVAREKAYVATDDAMMVEHFGHKVFMLEGEYTNIKITTPEDLVIGQAYLQQK